MAGSLGSGGKSACRKRRTAARRAIGAVAAGSAVRRIGMKPGLPLAYGSHISAARFPRSGKEDSMAIQLGQVAPDFVQDSTQGRISFHTWLGNSWGVLFSHPKAYTPVCTTELAAVARLKPQWEERNVKPISLSLDPPGNHKGWRRTSRRHRARR
jgi:AhpC/TSA family